MATERPGPPNGVHAVQHDRLADDALGAAMLSNAQLSCFTTDEHGLIEMFNAGAEQMFGYAASDVNKRFTLTNLSDIDESEARAAELSLEWGRPIAAGAEAFMFKPSRSIEDNYALTFVRRDRSRFPGTAHVSSLRNARDEIIGYLVIAIDDSVRSEREAAEQVLELRMREKYYCSRVVIESNISPFMMMDLHGVITDVNRRMVALSGRTRDELIGDEGKHVFVNPVLVETAIKHVLLANKAIQFPLTMMVRDGGIALLSCTGTVVHDRAHARQGVLLVMEDMTERTQIELALKADNAQLETSRRATRAGVAGVLAQLQGIAALADELKGGAADAGVLQREAQIARISNAVRVALALLADLDGTAAQRDAPQAAPRCLDEHDGVGAAPHTHAAAPADLGEDALGGRPARARQRGARTAGPAGETAARKRAIVALVRRLFAGPPR